MARQKTDIGPAMAALNARLHASPPTGPLEARKPWEHDAYCPGLGRDADHQGQCNEQPDYPVLDDSNRAGYERAMTLADAYFKAQLASYQRKTNLGPAMAAMGKRLTEQKESTPPGPRRAWEHDAYCPGLGRDADHSGSCHDQRGYPVKDGSNHKGYERAMRESRTYYRAALGLPPLPPERPLGIRGWLRRGN